MSRSLTLRACLLVAALVTTLAISLFLANAPSPTLASPPTGALKTASDQTVLVPDAKPNAGCWNIYGQPVPAESAIHKVISLGADDVWAVGSQVVGAFTHNLVLHWNGNDWYIVPSPNNDYYYNYLTAIDAISADDIWAGGISNGNQLTLMHWDGAQWTISPVPVVHGDSVDISALATNSVWTITQGGTIHWDGTAWSTVLVPPMYTGTTTSIEAIGPDDVWVGGAFVNNQPFFFHWDGVHWAVVNTPQLGNVQGVEQVTAVAPDNVWAVGYYASDQSAPKSTLIEHWDGTQWTIVPSPNPGGSNILNDVSFLSADDGWAVGSYDSHLAIVLHWDGSNWTSVTLPGSPSNYGGLEGVAAATSADVWAFGYNAFTSRMVSIRYTDPCIVPTNTPTLTSIPASPTITPTPTYVTLPASWNSTAPPNPGAGNVNLLDISIITANDIWAVGQYDAGASGSIALHWNGSTWANVPLPVLANRYTLYAVSAASHNDVWAIAYGNYALHWNGSRWTNHPVPTPYGVFGIAAASSGEVIAFSKILVEPEQGIYDFEILEWNGVSWDYQLGPRCNDGDQCVLYHSSLQVFAPNDIWIGGSDDIYRNTGVLLHYDGIQWSKFAVSVISPAGEILASAGTSSSDLWLSTQTQFLHWDGNSWTYYPHQDTVSDMVALSPSDVWAVGGNSILHWDGSAWGRVPNAPGQTSIRSIDAATCGDLWAVGASSNPAYHNMLLAHYFGPCPPPAPTVTPTPTPIPTPRCPGERFTDVCPSDYFYQHVLDLNDLGIIAGYNTAPPCDGPAHIPCFKPYNWSTRGQIAKIVSLAAGFNEDVTGQTFEDVPPAHTFYLYIERMASRGIINGYPCGSPGEPCNANNDPYFRPGNTVSRGQLTKMVSIAFAFNEPVSGQYFEDVPPGHTFYDYIQRLAGRNIISGYPCGDPGEPCGPGNLPYFRPANVISRGQIAKVVNLARTQPTPTPTGTLTPQASPTGTSTPQPTGTPQPTATGTPTLPLH